MDKRGFTLAEVLAVIVISVIIATSIFYEAIWTL